MIFKICAKWYELIQNIKKLLILTKINISYKKVMNKFLKYGR